MGILVFTIKKRQPDIRLVVFPLEGFWRPDRSGTVRSQTPDSLGRRRLRVHTQTPHAFASRGPWQVTLS